MTGPTDGPLFPGPLLEALTTDPGRPALEHGERVVSRGELRALVVRLVAGMRQAGLGPGRGVALHTAITPEGFAANVAAHALGCRVVGVRPAWDPAQIGRVLTADGAVDALVGDPSTLGPELVAATRAAGPTLLSLGPHPRTDNLLPGGHATAGPEDEAGAPTSSLDRGVVTTPAGGASGAPDGSVREPVVVEARPDDIARVNFTSGSTGRPKACARTYRTYSLDFRPDRWAPELARLVARFERFLVHHGWGVPVMFTFAARSLMIGGTVVLAEGDGDGDEGEGEGEDEDEDEVDGAALLVGAIERHRITGLVVIVPLLHQLLERLRQAPVDLGSLRALVVTGSPASPRLLAAATERLGARVWQGYGQAESGMISLLTPDDLVRHPQVAAASVGRPLPEVEISVRDPEDRPVAAGETGEICVRSPHAMSGYWGDPEQTGEVIRDGWLHTRDLGRLDASGLLLLTGRDRDVIIVDAEVCYAGAIEQVLARHPDVAQAYVVGIPDERTGEAVHAFVLPALGASPDGEALRRLVRSELTPGHVPATVTALTEVPVAPSGKPDKQALTTLARQRASAPD